MSGATISLALAVTGIAVIFAVTWLVVAQPWRARGRRIGDHWRIGGALVRFDFWLETVCVGRRRRRELRDELRANLWEATERHGSRQAVASLGSLRTLAAESVPPRGDGPRWMLGYLAAMAVGAVEVVLGFLGGTIWTDAAIASGSDQVDGSPTLMPWVDLGYESLPGGGFQMTTAFNLLFFVAPLAAFVLLARVWRITSGSTQTTPVS